MAPTKGNSQTAPTSRTCLLQRRQVGLLQRCGQALLEMHSSGWRLTGDGRQVGCRQVRALAKWEKGGLFRRQETGSQARASPGFHRTGAK
jgi:hypothetical protein